MNKGTCATQNPALPKPNLEITKKHAEAFVKGAMALSIGVINFQEEMKRVKELEKKKEGKQC